MQLTKTKRALSIITACAAFISCTPSFTADAASMISNGTFDSSYAGWDVYTESGGSGSLSVSGGQLAVNVSSTGSCNYAVQAYCMDSISLEQGQRYTLSYDISSTVNRDIEAIIQQNGGSYTSYTWKKVSLSQNTQHIDQTFTMSSSSDSSARLVINCGNQSGSLSSHTVYIDNITLEDPSGNTGGGSSDVPAGEAGILLNQVGFRADQTKKAVFRGVSGETQFSVVDASTGAAVYTGSLTGGTYNSSAQETDYQGDFSAVTTPGTYYISCGNMADSYTFTIGDSSYSALLDDTVHMLYLQRCGTSVNDSTFGHSACHTSRAKIYGTNNYIDVSGGWHDAGDYGRYISPAAKTVADLLLAYSASPSAFSDSTGIPESGNGVPDILDEAKYELQWMLKMQASDGGVYHKVTCKNFPGFIMPENETDELIVTPVSTMATADFCAVMAMAYEYYRNIDGNFADNCLSAAKNAWSYLESHQNLVFTNPGDISTGAYDDSNDTDERYWAAAQMYRVTGEQTYLNKFRSFTHQIGLDWANVASYGAIAYLTMEGVSASDSLYQTVKSVFLSQADTYRSAANGSPYGSPIYDFYWGSNMTVANAGIFLSTAYDLTGDSSYLSAAESSISYLLGSNPLGVCFVTGYGTVSPQNPHHRPSAAKGKAMPGMLVGGVNQNLEDPAAESYLASAPSAKCYIDHLESYSTNEITIYWNSPLVCLLAMTNTNEGGQETTTTTTTT
ncbi:MAG: glycoside hydrolase family 9 protein, partial [Ruminococcus sp.]